MSFWARTGADPTFNGDADCEPARADLVAVAPDESVGGMAKQLVSRACRLLGAVLLALIIWQLLTHWWNASSSDTELVPPDGQQKLTLSVYYEAMCPDSKDFVVDQLAPTFRRLHNLLNLVLVPYGKAKTHGFGDSVMFTCQHREQECWANKVHACGISRAESPEQSLNFAVCLMQYFYRVRSKAPMCAEKNGFHWDEIASCAEGPDINRDMVKYGAWTADLQPALHFVPTVLLQGSQENQAELLDRLADTVCHKFTETYGSIPSECA